MNTVLVMALALSISGSTVLVPMDDPAELAPVLTQLRQQNPSWLSPAELNQILIGHQAPEHAKASGLQSLLAEARKLEAAFNSKQAAALREQIFVAISRAPRLSIELIEIAAQTGHEQVAALLANGDKKQAMERARWVMSHYATPAVDARRHPPDVVTLLKKAKRKPSSHQSEVTIESNRPGLLYADGRLLGPTSKVKRVKLPQGTWKIWLETTGGSGRVQAVRVAGKPTRVKLDGLVENSLKLSPEPHFNCGQPCPDIAHRTASQLGVTSLVTVRRIPGTGAGIFALETYRKGVSAPERTFINRDGLPTARPPLESATALDTSVSTQNRWNSWWLVPFGAGQWQQDRTLAAVGYLALQSGLLGWNIWANGRYETSLDRDVSGLSSSEQQAHFQQLEDQRSAAMTSVTAFWAAVGLGVAEAIIVGLMESDATQASSLQEAP